MKRVILFLFFAQIITISLFAQDDQSVEPQTEKVEEVSASALEKNNEGNTVEEENTKEENTEKENPAEVENEEETPQQEMSSETKPSTSSSTIDQSENKKEIDQSDTDVSDSKSKKSSISSKDVETFFKWCLAIFVLWIAYKIIKYRYNRKCNNCGKWNSMKVVGKELVDEKSSSVTEKRKIRDSQGNTIRSYEVDVPATVYTYHIHRRCKHCGYQDIVTKQVKRKN